MPIVSKRSPRSKWRSCRAGWPWTSSTRGWAVPRCVQGPCTPTGNGEEVRAVSPAARGGSLASSRLLLRQSAITPLGTGYPDGAVISPDGSSVAVLVMNTAAGGPPQTTISVVQVSATTGRQTGVSYRMDTGDGFSFRFFGSDPSGRYLLLDAGPTSGTVNGWIDQGRLIRLAPRTGTPSSPKPGSGRRLRRSCPAGPGSGP